MKKTILLYAACILPVLYANATSIEVSGTVSGTWNVDSVLVMSDLQIPDGQLLTIEPGTKVIFWGHFQVDVQGKIVAAGLPGDSILFTVRDTANFYNQTTYRGGWYGIRFNQTPAGNDTSYFKYCRFEFGKALGDSALQYGGAVYARGFGKIRIENCLFFNNYSYFSGGAVYLWDSDAVLLNNTFSRNYAGNTGTVYGYGGGICAMHSSPEIRSNSFTANSSTGVGGGVSFDDADPVFYNNIFDGNYSALGGALGVLRSSPTSTFSNLLVVNNASLFFGGGICCIRSFPVFSNITIAQNSSSYGGGFYCNDSAAPSVYNSIIYGNEGFGTSVYIWDIRSAPNFYYSDIEGDTAGFEGSGGHQGYHGEYLDNINELPVFFGTGLFPFQLAGDSPCIDRGSQDNTMLNLPENDLAGAPRIWNNRIDMGTYEYNDTTRINPAGIPIDNPFIITPNPAKEDFCITFKYITTDDQQFKILSADGRPCFVFTVPSGTKIFNVSSVANRLRTWQQGVYFVVRTSKPSITYQKIIKL